MKVSAHVEKFRRFDRLRARFDPVAEFELWYWMLLNAGTAIVNAALHRAGLTRAERSFATQVPDVYLVMDEDGAAHHEIVFGVDIIHVGMPSIEQPLPPALAEAFAAMEIIERYRDPCIRADHPVTGAVIEACAAAYARCVAAAAPLAGEAA
jgi:hypothetical protein